MPTVNAVREGGEQAAPVVVDPAAMGVFAAEGQVGPQVRVLPEHRADDIRIDEAGMGPQHPRFRPLGEDPVDRAGVRMGVQEKIVLPRQLDHAPRHGLIGLRGEEVEFADRDPLEALQTVLEEVDHRRIVDPAADLAAPAVGAQAGQDKVRRGGVERAGAGVARARHQRPLQPPPSPEWRRLRRRKTARPRRG